MSRLFVAVWPTEPVRGHVRSLSRAGWEEVAWVAEQNWHVTLRFLGDADPTEVASALHAAQLPAADAEVGSTLSALGANIVMIAVSGLDVLAEAVRAATATIGFEEARPFLGHLTIGRSKKRRLKSPHGPPPARPGSPVRFHVSEVALVESSLSREGSVYSTLVTFPTVADGGR